MHRKAAQRPFLTEEHAQLRLQFALKCRDKPLAWFRRVLWTDECAVARGDRQIQAWVWRLCGIAGDVKNSRGSTATGLLNLIHSDAMRRLRDEPNDAYDVDEDISLHHKKPFGSGLKRQRVEFVPATESDNGVTFVGKPETKSTAGDLYASIVLGDHKPKPGSAPKTRLGTQQTHSASSSLGAENASTCPVCCYPS
ncbi:hypothetical protein E4U58_001596 [Claviceps cyperi]|nr:hypothetical protein E4U58_001596 [Claviceps cyperi]